MKQAVVKPLQCTEGVEDGEQVDAGETDGVRNHALARRSECEGGNWILMRLLCRRQLCLVLPLQAGNKFVNPNHGWLFRCFKLP